VSETQSPILVPILQHNSTCSELILHLDGYPTDEYHTLYDVAAYCSYVECIDCVVKYWRLLEMLVLRVVLYCC